MVTLVRIPLHARSLAWHAVWLAMAFALSLPGAAMQNLPVYTSPIDITGMKIELHAVAPDRNSGRPVDVALPPGLLGPRMSQLFATPLSIQLDRYWSTIPDPKTGKTPRDQACNGDKGIVQQVKDAVRNRGSSYSAYDVSCNLAGTGKLLVKQAGSTLYLGYLLVNNRVDFTITTPFTCHKHHGQLACPQDPSFTVTFATEIVTLVRTPALCQLYASSGEVNTSAVVIDGSNNLTGALAQLGDDLFGGHKFTGAQRAIEDTEKQVPLPLDSTFKELRDSDACTGKNPQLRNLLGAFRSIETTIQPPRGLILTTTHAGIPAPGIGAPNASSSGGNNPPRFTRPMIAAQAIVVAGSPVQVTGQYFPPNLNLGNAIPISFSHQGYGGNSIILNGGACGGGATELELGPANSPMHMERIPGSVLGACPASYDAKNLAPATPYQFRARDCDAVTCSAWSSLLRVSTTAAGSDSGKVVLTIDGGGPPVVGRSRLGQEVAGPPVVGRSRVGQKVDLPATAHTQEIGSGVINAQGTFTIAAMIPAGVAPGAHTIHAVNGSITAETPITIASSNASGRQASLMMVGLLRGESGCPNHPINSTVTGDTFMVLGSGFAAGAVGIHLDSANAVTLGTATAAADGTFCQRLSGVPASQAGAHTLVAVQNGAVRAQLQVRFVLPSLVH